jgi:hypothetical protein
MFAGGHWPCCTGQKAPAVLSQEGTGRAVAGRHRPCCCRRAPAVLSQEGTSQNQANQWLKKTMIPRYQATQRNHLILYTPPY